MKDYKNEKERLRSERERKEKQRQDIVNELKIKKVEKEGLKQENRSARIFRRGHMLEDFLVEPLVLSDDDVQPYSKVPPQVFTAKCSEPQANDSNGVGGGSGVAKPASLRTETGYKAKRRVRLLYKPKPKG